MKPFVLRPPVLVDSHVHIHPCFDLERFFDAAAANFAHAARHESPTSPVDGVLMLTEIHGTSIFNALAAAQSDLIEQLGAWRASATDDPRALLLQKPDSGSLLLVAGRQIRTRGGLEVLALGCGDDIAEGEGIARAVAVAREAGALPVAPWGFGKWTLTRKRWILRLLDEEGPDRLCLGDVGGRWRALPEPSLLRLARSRGFTVLPGSDPLPFPEEVDRAGSCGVVLPAPVDLEAGVTPLLQALHAPPAAAKAYQQGIGLLRFLRHQGLMQARKLSARPPSTSGD